MTAAHAPALPLFVYGTLLDEPFTSSLLERRVTAEPARLLDFELLRIEGFPFATAFFAPGETVEGRLYRDLTAEDYARLDHYEGVNEGLYQRIEAAVVAGDGEARRASEPACVYTVSEKTIGRLGAM